MYAKLFDLCNKSNKNSVFAFLFKLSVLFRRNKWLYRSLLKIGKIVIKFRMGLTKLKDKLSKIKETLTKMKEALPKIKEGLTEM